jgi:hypothetical protein
VVHTAKRNAIDLERASDEEDALVEAVEEDNALAPEAASEEDKDVAGLQRFPKLGRADSLADLELIE